MKIIQKIKDFFDGKELEEQFDLLVPVITGSVVIQRNEGYAHIRIDRIKRGMVGMFRGEELLLFYQDASIIKTFDELISEVKKK